jgi:hypothetical protein
MKLAAVQLLLAEVSECSLYNKFCMVLPSSQKLLPLVFCMDSWKFFFSNLIDALVVLDPLRTLRPHLKSSQAISHVNMELVSDVLETFPSLGVDM